MKSPIGSETAIRIIQDFANGVSIPYAETEKKTADEGTSREVAQGDGGENDRA